MVYGDRKDPRVKFEQLVDALLVGVDGTWARACGVADISASGARLVMKCPIAGLNLTEFFLVLTPAGKPYRRCQLVRVDGQVIGVRFVAN